MAKFFLLINAFVLFRIFTLFFINKFNTSICNLCSSSSTFACKDSTVSSLLTVILVRPTTSHRSYCSLTKWQDASVQKSFLVILLYKITAACTRLPYIPLPPKSAPGGANGPGGLFVVQP